MLVALPETSHQKILYNRQQRLSRAPQQGFKLLTYNKLWRSFRVTFYEAAWKPTKIMCSNPAVAYANLYVCVIYAIYFSFFVAFPLVFISTYNFTIFQHCLTYLCITAGTLLAMPLYIWFVKREVLGRAGNITKVPERTLIPALFASGLITAGIFIFGMQILALRSESEFH